MFLHRITVEIIVKTTHLVEIHRRIPNQHLLITRVIISQLGITIMVEAVSLHGLQKHIIHQHGQTQKAIVSLQKQHVLIVVRVILVTVRVILLPADLLVVVSLILHHQGHPHHLPAQVAEVVPGHQVVEVPNQAEEEDKLLS